MEAIALIMHYERRNATTTEGNGGEKYVDFPIACWDTAAAGVYNVLLRPPEQKQSHILFHIWHALMSHISTFLHQMKS